MDEDRSAPVLTADEVVTAEKEEEEFEVTPIREVKSVPDATSASIYGCR